jgi:hypothetical protein
MSPRKLLLTVDRSVNAVAFPFSAEVRTATTLFFADPYVVETRTYVLDVLYSRSDKIAIVIANMFSLFSQLLYLFDNAIIPLSSFFVIEVKLR